MSTPDPPCEAARDDSDAPTEAEPVSVAAVCAIDAVVVLMAVAAAVLTPAQYDDGWVLATVRGFEDTGVFTTSFYGWNVPIAQGAWWDLMLSPWYSRVSDVLVLRVPALIAIVVTWILLRRAIDRAYRFERRSWARWAAAAVFSAGIPAFLMTLRPEPFVALMAMITLSVVVEFRRRPGYPLLVTLGLLCGSAMTLHQTGWVVVGVASAGLPSLIMLARRDGNLRAALGIGTSVAIAIALSLLLLFVDSDLSLLRWSVRETSTWGANSYGPFDEFVRWDRLVDRAVVVRRLLVGLGALGVLGSLVRWRSTSDVERVLVTASVCGLFGLVFTFSKWQWHIGAVVPLFAVLGGVAVVSVLDRADGSRAAPVAVALGALAAVGTWSFRTTRGWVSYDLMSRTWQELPRVEMIGVELSSWFVWVGLVGAAAAAGWVVRISLGGAREIDRCTPSLLAALGFVSVLPVVATYAFIIRDARESDGWTFLSQTMGGLGTQQDCGWPDRIDVVVGGTLLDEQVPGPGPDGLAVAEVVSSTTPMPVPGLGVIEPGSSSSDGPYASPWYAIDERSAIAYWVTGVAPAAAVRVEVMGEGSSTVTTIRSGRASDSAWWSLRELPRLPSGARSIRLVVASDTPIAVSEPVEIDTAPLAEVTDRAWVNPNFYMYAPCVRQPSLAEGRYQAFDWVIGSPARWGEVVADRVAGWEAGCLDSGTRDGPCVLRLEFDEFEAAHRSEPIDPTDWLR